ncbi:toxin-antitoxin system HicB family antitoxin [Amycolatopsis alkalitolerans]|uniref:Toxin-antitoxin system HicB family antitoxin n=1 Tax=Amycolatopsis alkalitolerans TaxID=2547244 RepID=A0A5C4LZD1_9PSEU|nr:toxin-antitoxin system HicB family antitoxin [Amycolatopsis alkalitolerans]TNC22616.1 toxin-antitoxin system HicB family antitoxin [Amycolatopsis alkalitolerans]
MDLSPYITSLREDLTATASAGDEQTRRAAAVLSAALEPAVRLALMNALSDLAAEVTTQLADQVVEVRLDGRDVRVVVTGTGTAERPTPPPPPPPPPPGQGEGSDNITRMTLRMVEQIKGQAEQAAAAQGVSLNTFISQAVQGALHGAGQLHGDWKSRPKPGKQTGSHLHGWVEG